MTIETVITAAGDSRAQFLGGGFPAPKNLLTVDGKYVIQRAIESYVFDRSHLTVALNADEESEWQIERHLVQLFPRAKFVHVGFSARGALASALLASADLDESLPLVIAAGDSELNVDVTSIVEGLVSREVAAGTIVFPSSGSRWSYLSVDIDEKAVEVSEKYPVGHLATTGFFFFDTVKRFLDAARWVLMNNAHIKGKFYVSSTLNFMLSQGQEIGFAKVDPDKYRSWSLPADFSRSF